MGTQKRINVAKFQTPSYRFGKVQTDRRTESDAYEPTVQYAQVGSMNHSIANYIAPM